MTTPCNFAKNKIWGHTDQKTSTLRHHPKLLNPTEEYLFGLLPKFILTNIEIWVSGLKHCDKSKSAVSRFNFMHNPVLSYIPQELWTPYHNSGVYSWYNSGFYKWAHRRIL